MSNQVYANGMEVSCKAAQGKSIASCLALGVCRGGQIACTATALYRRSADALSAVALPPSMKGALHRVLATDLGLVVAMTREAWLHAAGGWSAVALQET